MFRGTSNTYAKFSSQEFIREHEQDATRSLRTRISAAIGLSPDFVDDFYVITKKDSSTKGDYFGAPDLQAVSGLSMLYPLELPGRPVPEEVINKTRGVVMLNTTFRFTLPVKTPDEIRMDKLVVRDNKVIIPGDLREIRLLLRTVRFRTYEYGLLLHLVKANGKISFVTQHNTLISGASYKGVRLHKQAKRGNRDSQSFTELIEQCAMQDPTLLTGQGWFPTNCLFSNKCYTFILSAVDVSHNEFGFDGVPHLTLIDCAKQWSNKSPPPGVNIGTPHHGYYTPLPGGKIVTMETFGGKTYSLPLYTRPTDLTLPYVTNSQFVDIASADAILHGSEYTNDLRLRGGGKIIMTGRATESGHLQTYHIFSTGDEHRRQTLKDNASMYHNLLDNIDKEDYDLKDPEQLRVYLKLFPAVVSPGDGPEDLMSLPDLQAIIDRAGNIPIVGLPSSMINAIISAKNIRHVWFNFLLCCNKIDRVEVFRMFIRYSWECTRVRKYLLQEAQHLQLATSGGVSLSGMSKEDIEERNYAIRKLQKARKIALGPVFGQDEKVQIAHLHVYMCKHRRFVRKVIKLVLFMTGEKDVSRTKMSLDVTPLFGSTLPPQPINLPVLSSSGNTRR